MKRLGYKPVEVAELLGISESSVYRAIKRGELPCVVVSGRKIVPAAALEAMFDATPEEAA